MRAPRYGQLGERRNSRGVGALPTVWVPRGPVIAARIVRRFNVKENGTASLVLVSARSTHLPCRSMASPWTSATASGRRGDRHPLDLLVQPGARGLPVLGGDPHCDGAWRPTRGRAPGRVGAVRAGARVMLTGGGPLLRRGDDP